MTDAPLSLYEFVYRAQLTEQALDDAGRQNRHLVDDSDKLKAALHFELLDPADLDISARMANVYAAITAFERAARRFVVKVLAGAHGEN